MLRAERYSRDWHEEPGDGLDGGETGSGGGRGVRGNKDGREDTVLEPGRRVLLLRGRVAVW